MGKRRLTREAHLPLTSSRTEVSWGQRNGHNNLDSCQVRARLPLHLPSCPCSSGMAFPTSSDLTNSYSCPSQFGSVRGLIPARGTYLGWGLHPGPGQQSARERQPPEVSLIATFSSSVSPSCPLSLKVNGEITPGEV